MLEIRIHGRGGQGGVVALETLAGAYFKSGRYVQVFPEFGAERRGAPVAAFLRVDSNPVRLRCKIYQPDIIIVLDPVLLNSVDITEGLKKGGWILINSDKTPAELSRVYKGFNIASVNATAITLKYGLGSKTSPIVNTTMLGAFCRLPFNLALPILKKVVAKKIATKTANNIQAAEESFKAVRFYRV